MIRIILVDDHPLVRGGLRESITQESDMTVVAEAGRPEEVLPAIRAHPCDIVLLDMNLPGRGGMEILKDVHEEQPGLRVLVVSSYPESQYAVRAIKAGAAGYLMKTCSPAELVGAIRAVMSTRRFISDAVADELAAYAQNKSSRPGHHSLSDRELQVLRLLAAGYTNGAIADTLSLSIKTVSTYRTRLLDKLNVTSVAELVRYAIEHQLGD
jgi:two-component system invasion response regulator UvrY